jgi:stringent starvation protein B
MMTPNHHSQTDQRKTVERLLNDEQVLVHINPQRKGVVIPEHLVDNRTVTLRLSRYFKGDLTTDDDKVTAELLFGQQYQTCVLPWDSIWGASSMTGEDFVWADAAPEEIIDIVLSDKGSRTGGNSQRREQPARSKDRPNPCHLRRVK